MPRSLSGFDADSKALCQGRLCRQAEYPVASVLQLEAGSDDSRCRCPSAGLVEGKELCLSPVLPDHEGTGEVAGIRRGTDTSHAVVAHTGLDPTLLDMSLSLLVLLPTSNSLLLGPQGKMHPLIVNKTLQLAAWHVSNAPCSRRAFVQTLPSSSWQLGSQAQTQIITPPGRNGIAGVSDGRLIYFAPLWQI